MNMNPLKTPHRLTLEDAGLVPQSEGMLKTPKQILLEEAGVMPNFKKGGDVSTSDMRAEMMANKTKPADKMPDIKNKAIFDQVKKVVNNPGKLNKTDFSPEVVRELLKLFGQEIFAPSKSK